RGRGARGGEAGVPATRGGERNSARGGGRPPPLPAGSATPSYQDPSGGSLLSLEDTTQGREVDLSPQITAKAAELATAKAAADFVKNQLRLEWYYGSLKGSTETLREGRGNDADL